MTRGKPVNYQLLTIFVKKWLLPNQLYGVSLGSCTLYSHNFPQFSLLFSPTSHSLPHFFPIFPHFSHFFFIFSFPPISPFSIFFIFHFLHFYIFIQFWIKNWWSGCPVGKTSRSKWRPAPTADTASFLTQKCTMPVRIGDHQSRKIGQIDGPHENFRKMGNFVDDEKSPKVGGEPVSSDFRNFQKSDKRPLTIFEFSKFKKFCRIVGDQDFGKFPNFRCRKFGNFPKPALLVKIREANFYKTDKIWPAKLVKWKIFELLSKNSRIFPKTRGSRGINLEIFRKFYQKFSKNFGKIPAPREPSDLNFSLWKSEKKSAKLRPSWSKIFDFRLFKNFH